MAEKCLDKRKQSKKKTRKIQARQPKKQMVAAYAAKRSLSSNGNNAKDHVD